MSDPLAKFELLQELSTEGREQLWQVLEERWLEAGQTLFNAQDEASEMWLLAEGQLRLEADGASIGVLGPGEVLGAASIVLIGRRECTAVSETPVRLLSLSRENYLRFRSDMPTVALALQEGILRELTRLVRLSLGDLRRGGTRAQP